MSDNVFQNSSQIVYELSQKNEQIDFLINQNSQYSQLVYNLQSEIFSLKNKLSHFGNLSDKLKLYEERNAELEKTIKKLSKEILDITKQNQEYKRKNQLKYDDIIKKLKSENDGFKTKIEMANHLTNENNGLVLAFDKIVQDKNNLLSEQDTKLRENKIIFQLKIANLKKRMIETVNETQGKVNDLNMQYADASTKLALFQNQQIMVKYQYQNKLFKELVEKNKNLENINFELKKELDIHKEVELSLAEKYKKIKDNNEIKNLNLTSYKNNTFTDINFNEKKNKKILNLHKKIKNLENELQIKQNDFKEEKLKNDSIQKLIKEKEKKYFGIFKYLEDCLKLFFNDDYLKSRKDIYINIELLKKGDFSGLSKEQKYTTLVIMMKYFLPFIYHYNTNIKFHNSNLKFHFVNNENNIKYILRNQSDRNESNFYNKKILRKKIFKKKENNLELPFNFSYNSFDNSLNPSERLSLISTKKSKKII